MCEPCDQYPYNGCTQWFTIAASVEIKISFSPYLSSNNPVNQRCFGLAKYSVANLD
jgi:hypothetical protein